MGGIETMLVNIANEQAAAGADVSVIVINDLVDPTLESALSAKVALYKLRRKVGSKNPLPVLRLNALLARLRPDVVHIHHMNVNRFVYLPSARRRMMCTVHAMCNTYGPESPSAGGHFPFIAISDAVRDDLKDKYGIDAVTVHNGIDVSHMRRRVPAAAPKAEFRIVQIGRLIHEVKGQDILIEALAILVGRGVRNVSVDFIGEGPSGQYLKDMAERLGVSDRISFLGNRPQSYVFGHLCDYDLLVQPSRKEGFGLTVAEAMVACVPVLVSDSQGPAEVVGFGSRGDMFETGNAAACADAIGRIMRDGPDAGRVEQAREYIVGNYSVSRTARRYLELYAELLPQSGAK